MRLNTLAFLLGILSCQNISHLPDIEWIYLILLSLLLIKLFSHFRLVSFFILGFLWMGWRAHLVLAQQLSPFLENQDVVVVGKIIDLPEHASYGWRFQFAPTQLIYQNKTWPLPGHLRLYWYTNTLSLRPHQHWRLTVRLKRARGLLNPTGFDYSAWLFQSGLRATGYVRPQGEQTLLLDGPPAWSIDGWRYYLATAIRRTQGEHPSTGMLIALVLGDKQGISQTQKEILQQTGIMHLMVISGSHISFIALFTFGIARWLWCHLMGRAALWLPAPRFAAGFSLLIASGYALLAGFSVPTQRALIMLSVTLLGIMLARRVAISHNLALALLLVLLWDPVAVTSAGFWLSFITVALIIYVLTNHTLQHPSSSLIRWGQDFWYTQGAITLGLFPLLLALFGYVPLTSWLANAIAIPWVNLVIVPLGLAGTATLLLLPTLASEMLHLAVYTLDALWVPIEWLASFKNTLWQQAAPPLWATLASMAGVLILLLPRGFPGRWLGIVWLLPLFFAPLPKPMVYGEIWFTLLDVGQGLAAVVQTQNHVLLYDAGPKLNDELDSGDMVVIPFLRSQGIQKLNTLLISHDNADHSGGAQSVLQNLPVDEIMTNVPQKFKHPRVRQCQSTQQWQWDGVDFQLLHPPLHYSVKKDNDLSCVLKVKSANGSLLLTGDIEKVTESYLVRRQRNNLSADILVVPHHGSDTSSTEQFIDAVNPKIALFSVGYLNRFHLPKEEIVQRYRRRGITIESTAQAGALSLRLSHGKIFSPISARENRRRYWHD